MADSPASAPQAPTSRGHGTWPSAPFCVRSLPHRHDFEWFIWNNPHGTRFCRHTACLIHGFTRCAGVSPGSGPRHSVFPSKPSRHPPETPSRVFSHPRFNTAHTQTRARDRALSTQTEPSLQVGRSHTDDSEPHTPDTFTEHTAHTHNKPRHTCTDAQAKIHIDAHIAYRSVLSAVVYAATWQFPTVACGCAHVHSFTSSPAPW